MRIVSGKFKGKKLADSTHLKLLRPTTDRNREALFNILFAAKFVKELNFLLENANVLDLCCGTGAVAFEALSRGAKHALLIDKNLQHLEIAKKNAAILSCENDVKFLLADANNLNLATQIYNFVYIDPPYKDNASSLIENLAEKNWIDKNSLIVVESDDINFSEKKLLEKFILLDQRKYGKTIFSFFRMR